MSQEREEVLSQLYANLCSQLGDAYLNKKRYEEKIASLEKKIAEIEAAKVVCNQVDQLSAKINKKAEEK